MNEAEYLGGCYPPRPTASTDNTLYLTICDCNFYRLVKTVPSVKSVEG